MLIVLSGPCQPSTSSRSSDRHLAGPLTHVAPTVGTIGGKTAAAPRTVGPADRRQSGSSMKPQASISRTSSAGEAVDDDAGAARSDLEVALDDRVGLGAVLAFRDVDDELHDVVDRAAGHLHERLDVLAGLSGLGSGVVRANELAVQREARLARSCRRSCPACRRGRTAGAAQHAHVRGVARRWINTSSSSPPVWWTADMLTRVTVTTFVTQRGPGRHDGLGGSPKRGGAGRSGRHRSRRRADPRRRHRRRRLRRGQSPPTPAPATPSNVDAEGGIVRPGSSIRTRISCSRAPAPAEFEARLAQGRSFTDFIKTGGGAMDTVRATAPRPTTSWSVSSCCASALAEHGTTTAEVKTGYGLTIEEELRHLRMLKRVAPQLPDPHRAHGAARPFPAARSRRGRGRPMSTESDEVIPIAARERLATSVDVFRDPTAYIG